MTIRLRAHHLLCLLTFAGKGYSPAFAARFSVIARRIHKGATIQIVTGPDDICAPVLNDPQSHCRNVSVALRDDQAARDVGALLGRVIRPGDSFPLDGQTIAKMRAGFAQTRIRAACLGCEWSDLCSTIASADYAGTVIPA